MVAMFKRLTSSPKKSAPANKGAKQPEKEPQTAAANAVVPNAPATSAPAAAARTARSPPLVPRRSRMQQYSLLGGIVCMVWSLLINMVRAGVLPVQLALFAEVFPLWVVVSLGALALGSVGWQLVSLRDCPEAAAELQRDVEAARRDLASRGFDFGAGMSKSDK